MNTKTAGPVPLVEVRRGGRLECIHYGNIAVCDAQGNVIFSRGDADQPAYLRSCGKPFQTITVDSLGAAKRWGLTADELAVVCSSHGAQPLHIQAVLSILKKCGLTPDALQCGPHPPNHEPAAIALYRDGKKPERIHNNCSGKHAGMLSACQHKAWPLESYLKPDHPLQQENVKTVATFAGLSAKDVPLGTDGCGVPSFYMSMAKLATAYARLANAKDRPEAYADSADRIVKAMCTHPVHIAHEGFFGTVLLEHLGQHLVAKAGAEGVFSVGLIGRNLGIALKIIDGANRAIPHVIVRLLEQFLHEVSVDGVRKATVLPILNTRGEVVGDMKVVGI